MHLVTIISAHRRQATMMIEKVLSVAAVTCKNFLNYPFSAHISYCRTNFTRFFLLAVFFSIYLLDPVSVC